MSKSFDRLLCLLFVLLASATSAYAYNIDDAVKIALKTNSGLQGAEADLKSAKLAKAGAYAGFLPTVSNKTSIIRSAPDDISFGPSDKQNYRQNVLEVSQPLFNGWGTVSQVKQAQANLLASKANFSGTYNSVIYETVKAYENVLNTRDLLALSENNLKTIAEQRRLAVSRFELGESTRTDIAQADARYASGLSDRAKRLAAMTAAEATFLSIVGEVAPQEMLPIYIEKLKLPASNPTEAVQQAIAHMPQLQAYKHKVNSARENVNVSMAQALPSISANAQFSKYREVNTGNNAQLKNSFYDSNQYTIQMSVPLFNPAIYANIGQYKQAASKAKADYEGASNDLVSKVSSAWAQYYAQQEVIKSALATIETAKIALEGVVEEFKLGVRPFLDILNAEQELFNAKLQHRQAESDYKLAAFNLYTLAGTIGKVDFKEFIYKNEAPVVESAIANNVKEDKHKASKKAPKAKPVEDIASKQVADAMPKDDKAAAEPLVAKNQPSSVDKSEIIEDKKLQTAPATVTQN